jgi:hypothetical protein
MPRKPFIFTGVCLALWLAFTAWSDWSGARKRALGDLLDVSGPVSVDVVLRFTPEPFHMTRLQEAGRMLGVQDRTIRLADVPAEQVRGLSREYWIEAIRRDRP